MPLQKENSCKEEDKGKLKFTYQNFSLQKDIMSIDFFPLQKGDNPDVL